MKSKSRKQSLPAIVFALAVPVSMAILLILPAGREFFLAQTARHPYISGFLKFALLATTGEILAAGVSAKIFAFPRGALAKAAVWGLIGMMIALLMPVYYAGVQAAQSQSLLPGADSNFVTALLTSTIINCTFGIAMMAFHRITDYIIEHWRDAKKNRIRRAARAIDWAGFVGFVVLRTLPFFWIPAHTVTFLLPAQYRVFLSAVLSIVLGLLLALAKGKKSGKAQ